MTSLDRWETSTYQTYQIKTSSLQMLGTKDCSHIISKEIKDGVVIVVMYTPVLIKMYQRI